MKYVMLVFILAAAATCGAQETTTTLVILDQKDIDMAKSFLWFERPVYNVMAWGAVASVGWVLGKLVITIPMWLLCFIFGLRANKD
jgi:hypothetical protein